jgi:hypothetical protein
MPESQVQVWTQIAVVITVTISLYFEQPQAQNARLQQGIDQQS